MDNLIAAEESQADDHRDGQPERGPRRARMRGCTTPAASLPGGRWRMCRHPSAPAAARRTRHRPCASAPARFPANWFNTFTEMMLTDLIPMVERTYRVLPGRENRAMAGLSMGGMQSFRPCSRNLDKFAYLGGFSGSSGGRGGFDPKTAITASSRMPQHSIRR